MSLKPSSKVLLRKRSRDIESRVRVCWKSFRFVFPGQTAAKTYPMAAVDGGEALERRRNVLNGFPKSSIRCRRRAKVFPGFLVAVGKVSISRARSMNLFPGDRSNGMFEESLESRARRLVILHGKSCNVNFAVRNYTKNKLFVSSNFELLIDVRSHVIEK